MVAALSQPLLRVVAALSRMVAALVTHGCSFRSRRLQPPSHADAGAVDDAADANRYYTTDELAQAAALMGLRMQPNVLRAAALHSGGCNTTHRRLQSQFPEVAT